jgi:hypothetical protein
MQSRTSVQSDRDHWLEGHRGTGNEPSRRYSNTRAVFDITRPEPRKPSLGNGTRFPDLTGIPAAFWHICCCAVRNLLSRLPDSYKHKKLYLLVCMCVKFGLVLLREVLFSKYI